MADREGEQARDFRPIPRAPMHVLEAKIRVAYSLAVRKRVGETAFELVPPTSRDATQRGG